MSNVGELGFKEGAAINQIAAVLAPSVTNGIIDGLAQELGFYPLQASNKPMKIRLLLAELVSDGRARSTATKAVNTLTMEAHHRTVAGNAAMMTADADTIVAGMWVFGLPVGDLAQAGWRTGLKAAAPATPSEVPSEHPAARPTSSAALRPQ